MVQAKRGGRLRNTFCLKILLSPVDRAVNKNLEQKVVEILDPFGPSIVDARLGKVTTIVLRIRIQI